MAGPVNVSKKDDEVDETVNDVVDQVVEPMVAKSRGLNGTHREGLLQILSEVAVQLWRWLTNGCRGSVYSHKGQWTDGQHFDR